MPGVTSTVVVPPSARAFTVGVANVADRPSLSSTVMMIAGMEVSLALPLAPVKLMVAVVPAAIDCWPGLVVMNVPPNVMLVMLTAAFALSCQTK